MIAFPAPSLRKPTLERFITGAYALGPNGHWPLDETSGTRARDLIGNNHGTYTGGCTLAAPGLLGPAATFDGTTGYVTIPDKPGYSVITNNNLTVFIIVKTTNTDTRSVVSKAAVSNYEWALVQELGPPMNYYCQNWNLAATLGTLAGTGTVNTVGAWHTILVSITYNTHLTIYADGVFKADTTTWAAAPGDGTSPINIGRRGDNAQYWDGSAQHLLTFPRALTGTDAKYLDSLVRAA